MEFQGSLLSTPNDVQSLKERLDPGHRIHTCGGEVGGGECVCGGVHLLSRLTVGKQGAFKEADMIIVTIKKRKS